MKKSVEDQHKMYKPQSKNKFCQNCDGAATGRPLPRWWGSAFLRRRCSSERLRFRSTWSSPSSYFLPRQEAGPRTLKKRRKMITTIIIIAHVLQRNLSSFSKSFPHNLKQSQHFTFVTGTEFFPTRVRAVNILCIGVNIDQMTLVARSRDRLANVVRYLRHPIRGSVGHVGWVTDAL